MSPQKVLHGLVDDTQALFLVLWGGVGWGGVEWGGVKSSCVERQRGKTACKHSVGYFQLPICSIFVYGYCINYIIDIGYCQER